MLDPLTPAERSARMTRVRSSSNRSTEGRVEEVLRGNGIEGWIKHAKLSTTRPDFYFPQYQLAIFVDGCFWHGCPVCDRNWPTNRAAFWRDKIEGNRRRDNRTRRALRQQGYHVMRIWEHELKSDHWLARVRGMLQRLAGETAPQ